MPSAVTRARSQVRQNGAVVEAITPNVVPSARRKRSAGAQPSLRIGVTAPYRRSTAWRISRCETTCAMLHRVAPPTSMYSMKRTSAPAPAGELQQVGDLVVVVAANDDGVELDRVEASLRRRGDPLQHFGVPRAARERHHALGPERVEADRDPTQSRRPQRGGVAREQDPIGGQRDVIDPAWRPAARPASAGRAAGAARHR